MRHLSHQVFALSEVEDLERPCGQSVVRPVGEYQVERSSSSAVESRYYKSRIPTRCRDQYRTTRRLPSQALPGFGDRQTSATSRHPTSPMHIISSLIASCDTTSRLEAFRYSPSPGERHRSAVRFDRRPAGRRGRRISRETKSQSRKQTQSTRRRTFSPACPLSQI